MKILKIRVYGPSRLYTKLVLGVCCFIVPQLSFSDDANAEFEKFKAQQTQNSKSTANEFSEYKKSLEADFSLYKKTYKDAYKAHKTKITQVWGDYRPGDKTTWVEYDNEGVRKSVNFETGEVEIEVIANQADSKEKISLILKKKILALMLMSKRDAFKNDVVAQAVEQKIKNQPTVKTAIVEKTPIMRNLVPEVNSGNVQEITKISKKYERQSTVDVRKSQRENKKIVRVKFQIPTDAPKKSKAFLSRAQQIATKENVPLTLVMAVMEAESAFNPMAKSHVPAYGLMQIVPRSAGIDATKYLFGKGKVLSPSYLFNSDKNIEIGGAYLHILYFRYLKKIENPVSRLYCAIAAYNTGAGNVARAFIGNTNINKAAKTINRLTPKQVYQKLRKDLPHKETKDYVKRVSTNMKKYQ